MIFFVVFYCCITILAEGAINKETGPAAKTKPKDIKLYEKGKPKPSESPVLLKDLSKFAIPHELTPSGLQLWEDDLILSVEQVKEIYDVNGTGIDDLKRRWPDGIIYYRFLNSSEPDREVIKSAIKHWMDNTCLKFYEVPDNFKANHIYFNKSKGCHSHVGMVNSRKGQVVSIGKGCDRMGIVTHEIGHALGFFHEQNRPDREEYIKVINDNIIPKYIWYFTIHKNTNNYKTEYDLTSVMHYGLTSFSSKGKMTMFPIDPTKEFLIGQRNGLSFGDLKLANIMYKCADRCNEKPNCYNGGFVNHKCKCICPPEFKGKDCDIPIESSKKICGGKFTKKTLYSPRYPKRYLKNTLCIWIIKAPAGKKIKLGFHQFDLHKPSEKKICEKDYLEVRIGKDYEGNRYCGNQLVRKKVFVQSNEVVLVFKATEEKNRGFFLNVNYI